MRATLIMELVRRDGHYCHYCGIPLQEEYGPAERYATGSLGGRIVALGRAAAHIDHKTPKRHGGGDALQNLVLACCHCNGYKGAKPYDQFVQEMDAWKARYYWPAILAELLTQYDYMEVWE